VLQKQEVLNVWPGVAHAPIRVKLNPQVSSVSRQIPAKFHPDGSTFWEMAADKHVSGHNIVFQKPSAAGPVPAITCLNTVRF